MNFLEVQPILRKATTDWLSQGLSHADLGLLDGEEVWPNASRLLSAKLCGDSYFVHPRLVQSSKPGRTLLVQILSQSLPLPAFGHASNSPVSGQEIQKLVEWLEEGCKDMDGNLTLPKIETVEANRYMFMRDPEIFRQSHVDPYPDGVGQIIQVWKVSMRFNKAIDSPIEIKIKGIGRDDSLFPGSSFDQIKEDDVYQEIGRNYRESNDEGRIVLDGSKTYGYWQVESEPYSSTANLFKNPLGDYDLYYLPKNGRAFLLHWKLWFDKTNPEIHFTVRQLPN